jgi:hypothetical protein
MPGTFDQFGFYTPGPEAYGPPNEAADAATHGLTVDQWRARRHEFQDPPWMTRHGGQLAALAAAAAFAPAAMSFMGGAGAAGGGTAGGAGGVYGVAPGSLAMGSAGGGAGFFGGAAGAGTAAAGTAAAGTGAANVASKGFLGTLFGKGGLDPTTLLLGGLSLLGGDDAQKRGSFVGTGQSDPTNALNFAMDLMKKLGSGLQAQGPVHLRGSSVAPGPAPVTIPGIPFQIGGGLGTDPSLANPGMYDQENSFGMFQPFQGTGQTAANPQSGARRRTP